MVRVSLDCREANVRCKGDSGGGVSNVLAAKISLLK